MKNILSCLLLLMGAGSFTGAQTLPVWHVFEASLESSRGYENPLYDVGTFHAVFTAPSGRTHKINGFWDGGRTWKIRFMPDEKGPWTYLTHCSDQTNTGLHGEIGQFECTDNTRENELYAHGAIGLDKGNYYFSHADGTPFFWVGCTAWNGGLKSTDQEWEHYLQHRQEHGYNVIQLVATQWRGCDRNSRGEVAFTGSGRIQINPQFFNLLDEKIDQVNSHGHLAMVVLLWALPSGQGRELSPGYYLPENEAILLARYMVARYGGNHVAWSLGGDGQYYGELEARWKYIGRQVFIDDPPGLVTMHPHGISWIGELYQEEGWYDFAGYQSTHGTSERHINFINKTVAEGWKRIPPMPVINMEPCYEQIRNTIFDDDVRNACYWSVFAAPPAGITYGADGVWPWLREGEKPLNHSYTPEVNTWEKAIELPGSIQIGYLGDFMRTLPWWDLIPDREILLSQPGDDRYQDHVSVLKTRDHRLYLVYFPGKLQVRLLLPGGSGYDAEWFDPVANSYQEAQYKVDGPVMEISNPMPEDAVFILRSK